MNPPKSLLLSCAAAVLACSSFAQQPPDLILVHGRVFTGASSPTPWAEAIAISGNRIAAVGTSDEIQQLAGERTRRIDLHGHLVIPGINDADAEFDPAPVGFRMSTSADATAEDVKLAAGSGGDETPADAWLVGTIGRRALDNAALTATWLDKAAAGRSIVFESPSGHACFFSLAALHALRIHDPSDPAGGWFDRDASGHMTGKAYEYACFNAQRTLADSMSDDDLVDALRTYVTRALQNGITTLQLTSSLPMKRYEKIVRHADVPLRIRMRHSPGTTAEGRDLSEEDAGPAQDRERRLTVISGTKWILDGTAAEETAALRFPYHAGSDRGGGRLNFYSPEISKMLSEALTSGDQPMFHADGDRTADALLDTMRSTPNVDWKSKRVVFEHGDGLMPDLLPAAQSLGIVVVQNPGHLPAVKWYPVPGYMPLKSLLRAGVPLAFGSGGDLNPFHGIATAVTFSERPAEAISRQQAIEAYTRGAAFAEFAEADEGTIAPGKLADLAVLSRDIFKVPIDEVADTASLLTIVDGKVVYEGGPLGPPERAAASH